jgi:GNAT superfamily N-acetyltransferase
VDIPHRRIDEKRMSSADCTVQRVSNAEADDVFSLIEEYYDAVQVVHRDDRATMLEYLADSESGVWLAYCDTTPVGCILFHPLPSKGFAVGEVKRLYVRPPFRRRGVAQALLEHVERFALSLGVEWLYLDTKDDLRVAIAFYERNGYVRCPRYNDNPQATIFMHKRLLPHAQQIQDPRR